MSNELGEIYGTVKDGKGSIIINSNIVEISGNLTTRGHIQLLNTNHEIAEADPSGILTRIDNLDNSLNILLTSNNDASFNNVDVSGSLNVQGEKVMTVPALDICGNDLSANTTYEITTGPPGSINNISFVKKQPANSRVYFSVQTQPSSSPNHEYYNYLNEVQSAVPSGRAGVANSVWNTSTILSSGGNDQASFPTNGFVVPRAGIYKIDIYQTVRGKDINCAGAGIGVYLNPTASTNAGSHYHINQCLAITEEAEHSVNYAHKDVRSESIVWLGQLQQGNVIKFVIFADNGYHINSSSVKGCYTIISVD